MVSSNGDNSGGQDRNVDGGSSSSGRRRFGGSLTERLRGVIRDGTDGDLVLDRSDVENGIVQWLRALDLQVLGACRSDERMKPLLKLDISNGFAEDRLMVHLSQHFEASEIGMLVRCLCIPLVSIRVGKVSKQGSLLCPTSTRGHLNLTLLPSSNMRISFIADDGCTERLAILSNNLDSSEVAIEEISADPSGRSFLLKLSESQISYFWCSEKSKLMGMELLTKMKDLLKGKPTLSHLTGIHESRLESFGTHLRAYFQGSNVPDAASSDELLTSLPAFNSDAHSPLLVSKSCLLTAPSIEEPTLESNLCLRANIYKDETTSNSCHVRSGIWEKLKQHEGPVVNNHTTSVSLSAQINDLSEDSKSLPLSETDINCPSSSLPSTIVSLPTLPPPSASSSTPFLSPYYCWCPPCPTSSLQCSAMPSHLPILPPLSTLLSLVQPPSTLVTSNLPLNVPKLPALHLPPFLPKPFARLPLPVSSIATLPASQQISTFTPFMSDPIVHTAMIGVCSSGQGYLVSGGPAISSAIPPMIPNFESAAEKSARETLRMLLASAPPSTCQSPMSILPPGAPVSLLTNIPPPPFLNKIEKFPNAFGSNHGSQGLRIGTPDFVAVEMSSSSMVAEVAGGDSVKRVMLERGNNVSMEDMASGFRDSEGCDCE